MIELIQTEYYSQNKRTLQVIIFQYENIFFLLLDLFKIFNLMSTLVSKNIEEY